MFSKIIYLFFGFLFASTIQAGKIKGFVPCDKDPKDRQLQKNGVGYHWQTPDDKVYYLDAGKSACGPSYTDYSNVVCVSTGWVGAGIVNHCYNWVQVFNPANGIVTDAYIIDTCDDGDPNSSFGCNDIYLSKTVFEKLAGNQAKELVDRGDLGQVEWRFVEEVCWASWAGLPGTLPDGKKDSCQGPDYKGNLRCGRKGGSDRIVGPDVEKLCNKNVKTCEQAEEIAKTLPHYKGGDGVKQDGSVAYQNGQRI